MARRILKSELNYCHLGNGLTIWKQGEDDHIAHVDKYRNLTIYDRIDDYTLKVIQEIAATYDGTISATQDDKIFYIRPVENYEYEKVKEYESEQILVITYVLK